MLRQFMLVFLSVVSLASSCEKPPGAKQIYSIWIKNNSNKGISFLVSKAYPDTIAPNDENSLLMLAPNEEKTYDQDEKWEKFFEKLPADTLSVFFFDNDTIAKYGFQQVRVNGMVLQRKDLSLQDLKNNNYTVVYP